MKKNWVWRLAGSAVALAGMVMGSAGVAAATNIDASQSGEVIQSPWSLPQRFAIDPTPAQAHSPSPGTAMNRARLLAEASRGNPSAQLESRVGWIPGISVEGELLTLEAWSASDTTGEFYLFALNHGSSSILGLITPRQDRENAAVGTAWLLASSSSSSPVAVAIVNIPVTLFVADDPEPDNHENDAFVEALCSSQGGLIYNLGALYLCRVNLVCAGSASLLYAGACGGPGNGRFFGWQNYGNDPPYQTDKAYHMPSSMVGNQLLLNPDWRAEFPYCHPLQGDGVTCWWLNPITTQYEIRTTTVHGTYFWPDGTQSFYSRTCTCKSMPNDGLQHSRFYTVPAVGSYLLTVIGNFSFSDSTGHYRLDAGSLRKYHIVGG